MRCKDCRFFREGYCSEWECQVEGFDLACDLFLPKNPESASPVETSSSLRVLPFHGRHSGREVKPDA